MFYKRAPHPTNFAHLSYQTIHWLNATLLNQSQMKQTFSLLSFLLLPVKYKAIAGLLQSIMCLNERSAADALGRLPNAIASPTQRSLPS